MFGAWGFSRMLAPSRCRLRSSLPSFRRGQLLWILCRAQARMRVEKRLQLPQPLLLVGIGPDDVVAMQRRLPPVDPLPEHPSAKVTDSDVQVAGEVGQEPFIGRQFDLLNPPR